jgi:serine/threonine-protein kinase
VIDIGSVVSGKYRLVRLLGDGGMGSVYEAQHTVLGSRVAIKVLHPELARRTGLVERFLQEARVAAQIRSPHVVHVADVDRTPEGHAYIVMELLEGEPLSSVLDRQRKIPVGVACEYTLQILEALEAAHALGVIHRDLKPENVFVTFAGNKPVLKLIDFGIAKAKRTLEQRNLTVAGVVMGTAEYMAPEQARSADKVDARADIYAVGVMLYEMIAGSRPVSGEDARVIAYKVERGEAVPLLRVAPDTPREIAGLVHHAMAARPELRFATATEMRLALQGVMSARRPAASAAPAARSGTAELSAPAVAAIPTPVPVAAPLPVPAPVAEEPPVHTLRAPPIATAMAPPALGMSTPMSPANVAAHAEQAPRRPGGARVAALVLLPVLVIASVVAILIGTGTWSFSTADTEQVPASSSPTLPASSPADMPAPATATTTAEVPALTPTRPSPWPPHPTPSGHASGGDAGVLPGPLGFPTAFPSTLPPFPSVMPFPSILPLPSGFPTTLPSGLPGVLPPWPTVPPPSPAPTRGASSGGAGGSSI